MKVSLPKNRFRVATLIALLLALGAVTLTATAFLAEGDRRVAGPNRGKNKKARSGLYLVRMAEDPVIAYKGGTPGLPATKPPKGKKIDRDNSDVVRYAAHLDSRHNSALSNVGGGRKVYDYRYTLNGFAAQLTADQVAKLAKTPGVISVEADRESHPDTVTTPNFLGLTAPGGLWQKVGGVRNAGEDIVIGVVDSGIWPEHPSFSDRTGTNKNGQGGKLAYHHMPGWKGKCEKGEAFKASDCNQKLITARYFIDGFGSENAIASEYISPRDSNGHGSHTASTAAGNNGVPAVVDGFSLGGISGMAPRARIAAYKACWDDGDPDTGGCFSSDSVAAIDQAVADGVDVINYSISGASGEFLDAVEVAFLFAADAGVFVATSAGNDGPFPGTVAHTGPWLTSVAAGTHDRFYEGSVTLGNGANYTGASLTGGTALLPLIYSGAPGVGVATDPDPTDPTPFSDRVRLCFPGTLKPAAVSGKIVLCDRGINARVDKSLAVAQAGGAGMVLRNTGPNTLNADIHSVPSVHVDHIAGAAIKSYMDSSPATAKARINGGTAKSGVAAPFVATFSARGPLLASGDILKPDVTAPGVDILAATSPAGSGGRLFDFMQGTSMSSPHVAGVGALLKQLHPDWTPAMIKSALMTTAYQVLGTGDDASPFAMGAGHIKPNSAADPGLVYNAGFNDYLGFLCGTGELVASFCPSIQIVPSNLNLASIAIGKLTGAQTVKRTLTNVGPTRTYTVSVTPPPGIAVTVTPTSLTLNTGQSASYTVKFVTQAGTPFDEYLFGSLNWTDGFHNVRSPLVVRPVAIAAPAEKFGTGTSGSLSYPVTFGFPGPFAARPHGLIPAVTTNANVVDDPTNSFDPAGPGVNLHVVSIPSGTRYARFSLFDANTDGNDDLDFYVYNEADELVDLSGGATAEEEVNLIDPAPGMYKVYVHGFETDGPDCNYTLFTWAMGASDQGNMNVTAPGSATPGGSGTIGVNWNSLATASKYLGNVTYHNVAAPATYDDGLIGSTVIRIDTP